eukprot:6192872-Pleurochrysis_carterae.AAC.1
MQSYTCDWQVCYSAAMCGARLMPRYVYLRLGHLSRIRGAARPGGYGRDPRETMRLADFAKWWSTHNAQQAPSSVASDEAECCGDGVGGGKDGGRHARGVGVDGLDDSHESRCGGDGGGGDDGAGAGADAGAGCTGGGCDGGGSDRADSDDGGGSGRSSGGNSKTDAGKQGNSPTVGVGSGGQSNLAGVSSQLAEDAPRFQTAANELLYLRDWHLVRDMPEIGRHLYSPPAFLGSDWLSEWCEACGGKDDYRFVYAGPAGTRTSLHHDVLYSCSWSVNVCGRKRWILYPPAVSAMLYDEFGELAHDDELLAAAGGSERWSGWKESCGVRGGRGQ